ncbi:MAG: branched-chain amino acid transaminase [Deltaproteobacteria bacterium]|nr:branched-chain amino acid transaminase [Deltaproteobacteria bacterium]MBI2347181.1 branched-chain amino acid transaminase [Deltaproteobacteria bacterium]MBI2538188.1 branched-chain amino acid transaminase [Deltaproteobacteria bacterium]
MSLESKKIWLDGEMVDWEQAKVHVLTHALHYGTGYFEGIRCYALEDGRSAIFRLDEHIRRFFDSGHILGFPLPYTVDKIKQAIVDTVRVNGFKECYIRPLAFLGLKELGLYAPDNPVQVVIAAWRWGAYLGEEGIKNGIRAKISSYTRHHVNVMMTKSKVSGNYINSVLAKHEVKKAGYDEAIMLDTEGYVAEASGENVFIVRERRVKTTPFTSILPGITRDSVLTIARDKGYQVQEERFTRDELYTADEAFFTGTAAEMTPIREVDNRKIGAGRPGPVTLDLQQAFFSVIKGKDKKYAGWLTYL